MNYSEKTIKSLVKALDLYKIYESNEIELSLLFK